MRKIIISAVLIGLAISVQAQNLAIPYGKTPIIDGVSDPGEWDDADESTINVSYKWDVQVLFKHNDTALYFAFSNLKTISGERYPDIMLDIKNDRDTTWHTDDWWLHASYNDCEGNGIFNNWQSCIPDHPGWNANNFPLSEPGFIEIEISYAKIGLKEKSCDTFGIALDVSNTYDDYDFLPTDAVLSDPSTWTTGILLNPTGINKDLNPPSFINIFPNPAESEILVKFQNPVNTKFILTFYNSQGQFIQMLELNDNRVVKLDISSWPKGIYFYKLMNHEGQSEAGSLMKE